MLNSCVFAARTRDGANGLADRVEALERYFAPLGEVRTSAREVASLGVVCGTIRFDGAPRDPYPPLVWGSTLPAGLAQSRALLGASDQELRGLRGTVAAIAADDARARLVTGARAPVTLYAARGRLAEAWSTHAVAAAWLADGSVRLDPSTLPELLAFEFVGGERSIVSGVRPLAPATVVDVTATGADERCYWPADERWAPLAADEAHELAERALLDDLQAHLVWLERPFLGLTAGIDSRAVAVAAAELGAELRTFTWGDRDSQDARGAAHVARSLGFDHETCAIDWIGDDESLARARADARWSEAGVHLGFGAPTFPTAIGAFLTGSGGETGRSYYYRAAASRHPRPSPAQLADAPLQQLGHKLDGAHREARAVLRARSTSWLDAAARSGVGGWRLLDVVYAEQRMQRWARGMVRRGTEPTAFGLASPELQRALTWLPLADRLSDGFHRRFIERHAPALAPEAPAMPRAPRVPTALRPIARRLRGQAPPAQTAIDAATWTRYPGFERWLREAVLSSPLISEGLGEGWASRVRDGYRRDGLCEALAFWAAAPVALSEAVAELEASPRAIPPAGSR